MKAKRYQPLGVINRSAKIDVLPLPSVEEQLKDNRKQTRKNERTAKFNHALQKIEDTSNKVFDAIGRGFFVAKDVVTVPEEPIHRSPEKQQRTGKIIAGIGSLIVAGTLALSGSIPKNDACETYPMEQFSDNPIDATLNYYNYAGKDDRIDLNDIALQFENKGSATICDPNL